jgi:hypothetical protein
MDSDSDSESDLSSDYSKSLLSKDEELPESSKTSVPRYSIGAQIQAITLLELGILHWDIKAKTGVSKSALYKLQNKAINRG